MNNDAQICLALTCKLLAKIAVSINAPNPLSGDFLTSSRHGPLMELLESGWVRDPNLRFCHCSWKFAEGVRDLDDVPATGRRMLDAVLRYWGEPFCMGCFGVAKRAVRVAERFARRECEECRGGKEGPGMCSIYCHWYEWQRAKRAIYRQELREERKVVPFVW